MPLELGSVKAQRGRLSGTDLAKQMFLECPYSVLKQKLCVLLL